MPVHANDAALPSKTVRIGHSFQPTLRRLTVIDRGRVRNHALVPRTVAGDESPIASSIHIEDVDAMATAMADGVESECVQLEAKPFHGRWIVVRCASMVLQFGGQDVATVHRLRAPATKWVFVGLLDVPGSAKWNGRAVSTGELVVCPPGSESFAFDSGGMQLAIVSVSSASEVAVVEAARAALEGGAGSRVIRLARRDAEALRQHLAELRQTAELSCRGGVGVLPTSAMDGVRTWLRRRLERVPPDALGPQPQSTRSQIVRRAEEFCRRHVGEPVSISQLSLVAGVSERSLRNAFYEVCTTSPKRYLRIWQLHQVRHALRGAHRSQATVTDVAMFHGFLELGRFAGEYKALFGEVPSQTLQKARNAGNPAEQASTLLSSVGCQEEWQTAR
jgi:AraC family ethanolamine operon transcriptional activator